MRKYKINKKRKFLILIITLIFIIIWFIYEFILAKTISNSAINSYLETINVDNKEIQSLEINYDFKIGNRYNIIIKYKDEPNLEYRYTYRINKRKLIASSINNINSVEEKIIPKHETPANIKSLYYSSSNEFKIIEMKYSFFDYIKDLIIKKDVSN